MFLFIDEKHTDYKQFEEPPRPRQMPPKYPPLGP